MLTTPRGLLHAALAACILIGAPHGASAYTKENHERSVILGAKMCKDTYGVAIKYRDLKSVVDGVLEPDELGFSGLQLVKQRFEPGAYGKRRNLLPGRIAAQSFHGSPNPTRPPYNNSAADQEKKKKTIRTPAAALMPNRLKLDVYSYNTNQQVRNRLLINASQFLCVSFAHKDDAQSARKFGNLVHMIGDTYSASHVQRSAPKGSLDNCGTEKIEWHFSMDLISWKLHRPADEENGDWRFHCLVSHISALMKLWVAGRNAVRQETTKAAKLRRANEHVAKITRLLCNSVLREDRDVLRLPAGGAAAGYSIASGTDNWEFFKRKKADRPIQPVGLTGPKEAEEFYRTINEKLRKAGKRARLWYPSRKMKDLCEGLERPNALPTPLRCTPQEIDWAVRGSDRVKTMWIPPRKLQP